MKKILYAVVLAMLMSSSIAGVASATHDPSRQGPGYDFVKGSSGFLTFVYEFQINARSKADGTNAKGCFSFNADEAHGGQTFKVEVSCLKVVRDNASIGGTVTESNDPTNFPVGGTATAYVSDNTVAEDPNLNDGWSIGGGPSRCVRSRLAKKALTKPVT